MSLQTTKQKYCREFFLKELVLFAYNIYTDFNDQAKKIVLYYIFEAYYDFVRNFGYY